MPSPLTPTLPHANHAPLPGYGNLASVYLVPTCCALGSAKYAETRAAGRAARLAAALAVATLHFSSIMLRKAPRSVTEEEDSENFSSYLRLFCTRMPVLRRQDLL